ncbi:MAG TPA: type II toxin-antitoxin system RelE/ParE family toxin [Elusimicrobiota bacterium]|nr:type II toxin-antitoxin system RelE/ParE family toxin [Elusimicrobiota bacterium]
MYQVTLSPDASEYLDWMPKNHYRKAMAIIARLAVVGPDLHRPHADHVRGKIRELRCGIATFEHRFLYFFDGKEIILSHGFLKKDDAIPEREIAKAEQAYIRHFSSKK